MGMKGVNKCIIVGNLGEDPNVNYSAAGAAITNISVATSDSWKDKQSGQEQEKTEWHRIVFFGKLAEIAGEYLRKGSKVYIEGKLQTRKWQDKEGKDRYTTEIVCDSFNGVMQMLGSKQDGQQGQQSQQPQRTQQQVNQARQQAGTQQAPQQYQTSRQPDPRQSLQNQQNNQQDLNNDFAADPLF